MILRGVQLLPAGDIARSAWSGLRRFQNIATTIATIEHLHSPPKSQSRNVRKQAEQIRYCLIQAEEYFQASRAVSISTKPVLMYYCLMSLAIAEVLVKHGGDISLDKNRQEHGHHGLTLKGAGGIRPDHTLSESGAILRAIPYDRSGVRFGTFALWHRTSREAPVAGPITRVFANGTTTRGVDVILLPADQEFPRLELYGMTLIDVISAIPSMVDFLSLQGIAPALTRATISAVRNHMDSSATFTYIFHPNVEEVLESVYEQITVAPNSLEYFDVRELDSGCIITQRHIEGWPDMHANFPNAFQRKEGEVLFCGNNRSLNEFGLFYLALYILGNYARYFPDKWMADVESSSPLALAAMELLDSAEVRVPVLALGELSRRSLIERM